MNNIGRFLHALDEHIIKTHQGHYSGDIQPKDLIAAIGAGSGFYTGNIIKYAVRNFKKPNQRDVLKIAHYAQLLYELGEELNGDKEAG